jgi:Tfp pilus assembly protein PilO
MANKEEQANKALEQLQENKQEKKKKSVSFSANIIKETLINYIIPLICLSASGLIGFFILMPSYNELPELKSKLETNQKLERDLGNKLSNLNRLVDFKSIVEENSDLVNKVLVSEELVPGLLTQVDRISRESGLSVGRLSYGLGGAKIKGRDEAEVLEYSIVTINLGTTGNFQQLKAFMKNIENAARIVIIDNFRYTLPRAEEKSAVGANFILASPYLYVESNAITDDPIDLDISDDEFIDLVNEIKTLKYYDPYEIDLSIPIVETEEGEEGEEGETPPETEGQPGEQPPAETPPAEQPPAEATETPEEELTGGGDSIFPQ